MNIIDAIKSNDFNEIKKIIDNDENIVKEIDSSKALFDAIRIGNTDVVRLLLDVKVNVNIVNDYGSSTISGALGIRRLASDLDDKNDKYLEIIKMLINYEAEVNHRGIKGATPLIEAVKNHDIHACHLLLVYQADANMDDNSLKSALYYAIEEEQNEMVDFLRKPFSYWYDIRKELEAD